MAKTVFDPPLTTTSIAGWSVSITSVDPALNTDQICGEITTSGAGTIHAQWNEAGIMRGGVSGSNLDMRNLSPVIKKILGI